ncbi:ATP-binding cassette domain-containing protein [Gammaproteobacteria bacterium]|nr:ATP-binding cassette domain-containing protein [Gammaproteobacteria bacterium]
MINDEPVVEIKDVKIKLGSDWVHQSINLTVNKGEVLAIVGGSGSGKTTLLREMLMLQPPDSGSIKIFGEEITTASYLETCEIQKRCGVLFQQNALFSSLNLLENTSFPLKEHTKLDKKNIEKIAAFKIVLAGLSLDSAYKFPSELSGGMQKRAALARAIVLDPELIFLDEPSAGLDPVSADAFDDLILNLKKSMGLTVIIVTHDLDSLWRVTDRVAFLGEGKVLCVDKIENLVKNKHPLINNFFCGARGRTAKDIYQ